MKRGQPKAAAASVSGEPLAITVVFTGGAAAALMTVAALRGTSPEREVIETMANHAACVLADSNIRESPEYAEIFGVAEPTEEGTRA